MTATPVRYMICDWDVAKGCHNAEEYEPYERWDYSGYLVDTVTNMIVYNDRMEPEDATLDRALHPLIDLLNNQALRLANAEGEWR